MDNESPKRSVKIDINVPDNTTADGAKCTITGLSADVLSVLTTTLYQVASKVGMNKDEMKEVISKILDDVDTAASA